MQYRGQTQIDFVFALVLFTTAFGAIFLLYGPSFGLDQTDRNDSGIAQATLTQVETELTGNDSIQMGELSLSTLQRFFTASNQSAVVNDSTTVDDVLAMQPGYAANVTLRSVSAVNDSESVLESRIVYRGSPVPVPVGQTKAVERDPSGDVTDVTELPAPPVQVTQTQSVLGETVEIRVIIWRLPGEGIASR